MEHLILYRLEMLITIVSYLFLWDGRSLYRVEPAPSELIDSLTGSINLSFSTPSFPMLRELRDSIFSKNGSVMGFPGEIPRNIKVSNVIRDLGRRKLTDLEIAALLYTIADRYELNPAIYCITKYDPRTGDLFPFDLTPLYGTFAYGCYPVVVLDGIHVLSPRRFSTTRLLSDLVRFPEEIFQTDAPPLVYQLRGFRCAFVESLKRDKEPSPQEFRVLK